ncbi:MAG: RNA-binding protein [Thermoplasmatales archaeon]|nr:RNA-binding protein [Thermoplasmatales archaeon]
MAVPLDVLKNAIDKKVSLLIKDGRVLEGSLGGYDDHMNMVIDDTTETLADGTERRLGTVVLRGNNIIRVTLL